MKRLLAFLLCTCIAPPLYAASGLILAPDDSPAAGATISVVGHRLSIPVDASGRFDSSRLPEPPFTIVVIGRDATVYPPIRIESRPVEDTLTIHLEAAFREEITVVSGIAPGIQSLPGSASTMLGEEELEIRTLRDPADAVDETPGIARSEESHAAVPSIRGMSRGRTLILFDGSPITTERRAGVSATFVDPFTLAGIDVARGAGSVTYGSDAFGGVIDLRPRYPTPGSAPRLRWRIQGSTLAEDLLAGAAEWSQPLGPGAILIQAHGRDADDSEDAHGSIIANSSFSDYGFAARWMNPVRSGELRVGLTIGEGRDIARPSLNSDTDRTVYPVESSRRVDLTTDLPRPAPWTTLQLKTFAGRYRLFLEREQLDDGSIESSDVKSWDAYVRLTGTRPMANGLLSAGTSLASRLDLRAVDGFGTRDDFAETVSIEDADRHDLAAFAGWDVSMTPRATLSIGARVDQVSAKTSGGSFGAQSISHTAPSGYLAFTTRTSANSTTAIQLSTGFRDPSLSDRFFKGPTARGFVTGNPDLDPERSLQLDALWRWSPGRTALTLSGYSYRIEDLVERYRVDREYFFRNRGSARVDGLEVECSSRLAKNATLDLAGAWSRGTADGTSPLDGIEPINFRATLRWFVEARYAYATVRTFLDDERPGPSEINRPAYTVVDLGTGWRFGENIEVRLNLDNALDQDYAASADEDAARAAGRSLTVTLEGTF